MACSFGRFFIYATRRHALQDVLSVVLGTNQVQRASRRTIG